MKGRTAARVVDAEYGFFNPQKHLARAVFQDSVPSESELLKYLDLRVKFGIIVHLFHLSGDFLKGIKVFIQNELRFSCRAFRPW